jgi:hypothetical protein
MVHLRIHGEVVDLELAGLAARHEHELGKLPAGGHGELAVVSTGSRAVST